MIPFLKGFTSIQAFNQEFLKDDGGTKGMFYVKMADGTWGEQIAEFAVGGQKMNVLVSTQEQNLGFNGFHCNVCHTTNVYDDQEKDSKKKKDDQADELTIYHHYNNGSERISYGVIGNIYEDSIDMTSNKTDAQVKSMVADLEFMSLKASTPPFKPNDFQLDIDGWVGLKSTREPEKSGKEELNFLDQLVSKKLIP